jgi:hypothetical protein
MKALNIKKLQESFVGKVCTILTTTVNKVNFDNQQFSDFFTGIIESLDEDGVFSKHHITGCKNYYSWQYIVGILEEQVISESESESDIQYSETVDTHENDNQEPILSQNSSQYIDLDMIANLAAKANQK